MSSRRLPLETLERRVLLTRAAADAVGNFYDAPVSPRVSIDLTDAWRFLRSDSVVNPQSAAFDDSTWSTVSLPHTWNALDGQDGGGNYSRGAGWYRKTVTVPAELADGESLFVRFEGSSVATTLFIDGTQVGTHVGAFGAFVFNVTSALAASGSHVLAVKVDNASSYSQIAGPQAADFTTFGGLYRDVSLLAVSRAGVAVDDFASGGVYFSATNITPSSADVSVRTNIRNLGSTSRSLTIRSILTDQAGIVVADSSTTQSFVASSSTSLTQSGTVASPHLWNGRADPYLHHLYVEVRDGTTNALLDVVHERVGIRSYAISPTQGFLLNGQPYQLRGASLHQDRLNAGWAISDANVEEDVDLFMEMGATAIRTAHYQQRQRLYELADEKGLLIYTEIPNVGSGNGGAIPSTTAFADSMQQQLREMIRQNYNHPSIVVWGVYNEVSNNTSNTTFVSNLSNLVHSEDPTRLSVGASWNGSIGNLERATDVVAFNRYHGWYYGVPADLATQLDNMHAAAPTVSIGMSEYGAGAALTHHQQNPPAPTAGGLWHPEEYQALYHERSYRIIAARPWIWSVFVWNMCDFAVDGRNEGDTRGRNDKGLVSYDRSTRKDAFYLYKANWSADPTIHITSERWHERSNANTELKVYANVQNLRATVNGVDVGTLTDTGAGVWIKASITLSPGDNTVVVTGTRNGVDYTDTVVWHYTPPPSPFASADYRINFQPADSGTTPAGYGTDSGAVFGPRANGQQYGWSADNTANTRRRNVNADSRYDTLIHLQYNGSFMTWEHALPNGVYDVFLAAGDPSYLDSLENFRVEGVRAIDGDGQDNLDTFAVRVLVTDGRLTISPDGINTKLNFVEIKAVDLVPPVVESSAFERETGHSLRVVFSEAIDISSLSTDDLTVRSMSSPGQTFQPSSVTYLPQTRTAIFSYAIPLPDDRYQATLDGVRDVAGFPQSTAYTFAPFHVLAGDADGNAEVNFNDLLILARNYNQPGRTFSQGNFDYSSDGVVGFNDLLILARRYGGSLLGWKLAKPEDALPRRRSFSPLPDVL